MPNKKARPNRSDSAAPWNNDPNTQGTHRAPFSKPWKPRPNPAPHSNSRPQTEVCIKPSDDEFVAKSSGRSYRGPKKNAGSSRRPPRIEKEKMPNDRSYQRPNQRRPQFDEPISKKSNSYLQGSRNVDTLLDDIIQNAKARPSSHTQPQPQRCQPSTPLNGSIPSKTSPALHNIEDIEAGLDNIIRNHKFEDDSRLLGYQPATVEDDVEVEPDSHGKNWKSSPTDPISEEVSDGATAENVGVSPGTTTGKKVHWAETVLGPSGTGQAGLEIPTKSALAQHVSLFNEDASDQPPRASLRKNSQPIHKSAAMAKVPIAALQHPSPPNEIPESSPILVRRPLTPSSEPPIPKKSFVFDTTSVHPTKPPTLSTSLRRSSRLQDSEAVPSPSQDPLRKPSHASGVTCVRPAATRLPTPPVSPRRSPRLQLNQSSHTDLQPTSGHKSTIAPPVHPFPDTASIRFTNPSLSHPLVKAELDHLRSDLFDPTLIRPVLDLSQVFGSMTSAFGEPGTGILQTQFVPPSPKALASGTGAVNIAARKDYKGQKYSMNMKLKSRHLDIELLKVRFSHAMLLSFNLAPDARRDAINIGDLAEFATVPGLNLPGRSLFRGTYLGSRNTSGIGKSKKEREHIGMGMLSGRIGNRRRNSNKDTWIVVDGQRKRRRESDGDLNFREKERKINLTKKLARVAEQGDFKALAETSREISEGSSELGRAGTVNVMFWRFVRVSALVEVDAKTPGRVGVEKMEETQTAWWAVPERAVVGMF